MKNNHKIVVKSQSKKTKQISDVSIFGVKTVDGKIGGESIKLFYSKLDSKWTQLVRGKKAAQIVDDGNGVDITFRGGTKVRLDYGQLEYLQLLLREYRKHQTHDDVIKEIRSAKV